MDFGVILSGLGAAASGGVLGLFGAGIKAWTAHKADEAKRKFDLAMRKADRDEMQLEHDLKIKQVEKETERDIVISEQNRLTTELQVEGDVERAGIQLRASSYEQDKATYGGGFVDVVRGLMRPMLTLYFAFLMAYVAYKFSILTGGFIPADTAQSMFQEIINSIIFLATTCVTWWFGDRPVKRAV